MCVTNTCEYYWGCVSGDSEIYVKTMSLLEPGSMDYITMEELWKKLKKRKISHNGIKEQPAGPDYLYCDTEGLYVYDIRKPGFVKVTRVIRNKTKQWRVITLSHKDTVYTITCTLDHPFPTVDEDGKDVRLSADKLKKGYQIRVEKPKKDDKYAIDINKETISEQKPDIVLATITSIEDKTVEGYSYDLTTESDHFTVNHIDSHNCRAFLSPYYERGGFYPADENDKPVFTGRWNGGVVSLHLPMILAKARKESKDFYEVLDYYLELIRNIHKRTRDYLGEMKASVNPLQFCEGGFYRGHLKPTDKIKPLLDYVTFSYGITALNELNRLYNGKSIREDGEFPLEVMEYINKKLDQFKKEDHILYAVYGTPAESLCTEGNTLVQTVDGYKKIKDITTDDLVYTYNETEKKVELKRVLRAGKSKKDAKVVKVTTTNGQTFICTPDHPFGVRTMITNPKTGKFLKETVKYIKAKDLKKGYRLKSNYIRLNYFGRPECSIYHNGRRQLIHDINAEYAYGKKPEGHVVHHKDGDVTNNKFENLQYMAADKHRRLHMKDTISKYSYTPESQSGEKNSFYGKHHTDETKKKLRLKKMGKSIEVFDLSEKHVGHFDCATDAKRAGLTVNLVVKACKGLRKTILGAHFYKDHYWYYTDDCSHMLVEENHKVKSVEYLDETYDVYNMTVEDNANYFIGGDQGILVHNCGTQVKQFRKMYGIIENVSDREYVSNSFHCHVSEDMDPIEKQDKEHRFWDLTQGGRIQYVKYPIDYNYEAMATFVRRAMDMGLYEGLNMSLSYCDDCGHAELDMDECPVCNSKNIIRVERMNG